ncbi:MAG: hypothetical protein WCU88_00875 [Elusimicrobiota bacterium]|jgi:hypothetical protein
MAEYYKRRAKRSGPNKNEQRVQRSREAAVRARSASLLSDIYPSVQKLSIHLEFSLPKQPAFEHKDLSFTPSDVFDCAVACPGRCGTGAFKLAAKLQSVIEARQTVSESSGACQEPVFAGSSEACGLQLRCKIEVSYFPPLPPAPAE